MSARGSQYGTYYAAVNADRFMSADTTASAPRTQSIYRAAKPGETPRGIVQTNPGTTPGDNSPNPGTPGGNPSGSLVGGKIGMIIDMIAATLSVLGGLGFAFTGGIRF